MTNQITLICPYLHRGMWVFDDERVGLREEPFIAGVPAILEDLLRRENIPDPKRGFRLLFSAAPFPGHQLKATWVREEGGGNWYEAGGRQGWLCPALFKYFQETPNEIYVQVLPRVED
jgi:hypothetical protein